MSSASELELALNRLQIFTAHNDPSTANSPSIYGLKLQEGRLISNPSCSLMQVIELICTIVSDCFRSLLCSCCEWAKIVDESRQQEQNLIRATLIQDVATVSTTPISPGHQALFLRVKAAFNQLTASIRDHQTSACMNALYFHTGWDLGEELPSLSIENELAPVTPSASPQNNNQQPTSQQPQAAEPPPAENNTTPAANSQPRMLTPEERAMLDNLANSLGIVTPPPSQPAPIPRSSTPNTLSEEEQMQLAMQMSQQDAFPDSRPPSTLVEDEQLRAALLASQREQDNDSEIQEALRASEQAARNAEIDAEQEAIFASVREPVTPTSTNAPETTAQPDLPLIDDNPPRSTTPPPPLVPDDSRTVSAPTTTVTAAETIAPVVTPLPFDKITLLLAPPPFQPNYKNLVLKQEQTMAAVLDTCKESDIHLVDQAVASGFTLPEGAQDALNQFYQNFVVGNQATLALRSARALVWHTSIVPVLNTISELHQKQTRDDSILFTEEEASHALERHMAEAKNKHMPRNRLVVPYYNIMNTIFASAGKEIICNYFVPSACPVLKESTNAIKELMMDMISDTCEDLELTSEQIGGLSEEQFAEKNTIKAKSFIIIKPST